MLSNNIRQADLLIARHRYKEAEELLRLELTQNMENAIAFSMLAITLASQDRAREALPAVRRAISLEPDTPYHFYAHSFVLGRLTKYEEGVREIQTAIRLNPENVHYHGQLSNLYLSLKEWKKALEAAEKGLELDPDDVMCANQRALALRQMGRKVEASQTIDGVLRRDPENAGSHANQGWTYLHQGQPKEAQIHFREALRLQPDMDWARRGMIEALKARNIIYRVLLAYFLWMSRFKGRAQWGIIIGVYVAFRLIRTLAQSNPALEPWLTPLLTLYIVFAFSTWIASPLFNLLLRLDPFGRMMLNERETMAANLIGLTVLTSLGFWISSLLLKIPILGTAAIGAFAMIVPVSGFSHAQTKRTRLILGAYAASLVCLGLGWLAAVLAANEQWANCFLPLFILGWIAYGWVANSLIISERS